MWKRDREILHCCLSIQLLPAGNAGNGRDFLLPPAFVAILPGLRRLLASALDSPGLDCGCPAFLGRAGALNWELAPEADLQTGHRLALSPAASDSPGRDRTLKVILQSPSCKTQDLKPGCLAPGNSHLGSRTKLGMRVSGDFVISSTSCFAVLLFVMSSRAIKELSSRISWYNTFAVL